MNSAEQREFPPSKCYKACQTEASTSDSNRPSFAQPWLIRPPRRPPRSLPNLRLVVVHLLLHMSRSLLLSPVVRSLSTCYYGRCPHLRALLHIIPSSGLSRHLFVAVLSTLRLCGVSASKARTTGCRMTMKTSSRRFFLAKAVGRQGQRLRTSFSSKGTPGSGFVLYVAGYSYIPIPSLIRVPQCCNASCRLIYYPAQPGTPPHLLEEIEAARDADAHSSTMATPDSHPTNSSAFSSSTPPRDDDDIASPVGGQLEDWLSPLFEDLDMECAPVSIPFGRLCCKSDWISCSVPRRRALVVRNRLQGHQQGRL